MPGSTRYAAARCASSRRGTSTRRTSPWLRAGITLRRRTGGTDAGWHLKLPTKEGRFEVHEPLSRARKTVPKSLRSLLVAHTRDETLRPVAVVRTSRHVQLLLDDEGTALAEFCDDHVTAEVMDDPEPVTWREWEVELVDGDTALLAAAAELVEHSGGTPSETTKLGKALGHRVPVAQERVSPRPRRKGPASQVVQARLLEQVTVVRALRPPGTPRCSRRRAQDAGRRTPAAQRARDLPPLVRP